MPSRHLDSNFNLYSHIPNLRWTPYSHREHHDVKSLMKASILGQFSMAVRQLYQ